MRLIKYCLINKKGRSMIHKAHKVAPLTLTRIISIIPKIIKIKTTNKTGTKVDMILSKEPFLRSLLNSKDSNSKGIKSNNRDSMALKQHLRNPIESIKTSLAILTMKRYTKMTIKIRVDFTNKKMREVFLMTF